MHIANKSLKMAKQVMKWRESASLIILSRDSTKSKENSDYKVLLFSRHEKASFMPSNSVFPGGACDPEDESPSWLKYFQSMGVQEEQLQKLIIKRNPDLQPQPGIFQIKEESHLHRDISLRITAIRETFEEMGIMLCRSRKSLFEDSDGFGSYLEDFDRLHWQHLVHNDASQFLNLCKMLDVVPDLWSLNEWSAWLTPAVFNKRFETAFYMVALQDIPNVILEEQEGTNYKWMTPKDTLISNINGDVFLAPPQILELSRLLNFDQLDELVKFAQMRAQNGTILLLPVQQMCTDGMVSLLPGDSDYPNEPNAITELVSMDMTKEQCRRNVKKLHRFEYKIPNYGILHINYEPIDGHLKPIALNYDYISKL